MHFFGRGREEEAPILLEAPVTPRLRTANLGAAFHSQRIGGDLYDFVEVGGDRVLFALFDIAGHRERRRETDKDQTAAIGSAVRTALQERGPALITSADNLNDALTALALELNRGVLELAAGVHNTPAFLACFDEEVGIMSYINAGHTPALLHDEDGTQELVSGGLPFGLFSHVVHEAQTVVVRSGAAVLAISRGIVEAKSGDREFGLERVSQFLAQCNFTSAQDLCHRLLEEVAHFTAAPSFWGPRLAFSGFSGAEHNDLTAVALMRPAVGATLSAKAS